MITSIIINEKEAEVFRNGEWIEVSLKDIKKHELFKMFDQETSASIWQFNNDMVNCNILLAKTDAAIYPKDNIGIYVEPFATDTQGPKIKRVNDENNT